MTTQLGFELAHRTRHDVATSAAEAERRRPLMSGYRRRILLYILGHGRQTRRELARALKIEICSVCPAVDRLREGGEFAWLEQSQLRRAGGFLLGINPIREPDVIRMCEQ